MAFNYRDGILIYQIAGDDRPPAEIADELRADDMGGNEIRRALIQAEALRALIDKRIAARFPTAREAFTHKEPTPGNVDFEKAELIEMVKRLAEES